MRTSSHFLKTIMFSGFLKLLYGQILRALLASTKSIHPKDEKIRRILPGTSLETLNIFHNIIQNNKQLFFQLFIKQVSIKKLGNKFLNVSVETVNVSKCQK